MIIVHSSSQCDVCLDTYNWTPPGDKTPHAIPCGHMFCKTCLESITPPICPLCRKSYDRTRIKKLHMDQPDSTNDDLESEFMIKMGGLWKGRTGEAADLLKEIDDWLASREQDAHPVLRATKAAFLEYHKLVKKRSDDHQKISSLRSSLRSNQLNAAEELETRQAIEESYQTQIDELTEKLAASQAELQALKAEKDHKKNHHHSHRSHTSSNRQESSSRVSPTKHGNSRGRDKGKRKARERSSSPSNPLPHPPEPLPQELFSTSSFDESNHWTSSSDDMDPFHEWDGLVRLWREESAKDPSAAGLGSSKESGSWPPAPTSLPPWSDVYRAALTEAERRQERATIVAAAKNSQGQGSSKTKTKVYDPLDLEEPESGYVPYDKRIFPLPPHVLRKLYEDGKLSGDEWKNFMPPAPFSSTGPPRSLKEAEGFLKGYGEAYERGLRLGRDAAVATASASREGEEGRKRTSSSSSAREQRNHAGMNDTELMSALRRSAHGDRDRNKSSQGSAQIQSDTDAPSRSNQRPSMGASSSSFSRRVSFHPTTSTIPDRRVAFDGSARVFLDQDPTESPEPELIVEPPSSASASSSRSASMPDAGLPSTPGSFSSRGSSASWGTVSTNHARRQSQQSFGGSDTSEDIMNRLTSFSFPPTRSGSGNDPQLGDIQETGDDDEEIVRPIPGFLLGTVPGRSLEQGQDVSVSEFGERRAGSRARDQESSVSSSAVRRLPAESADNTLTRSSQSGAGTRRSPINVETLSDRLREVLSNDSRSTPPAPQMQTSHSASAAILHTGMAAPSASSMYAAPAHPPQMMHSYSAGFVPTNSWLGYGYGYPQAQPYVYPSSTSSSGSGRGVQPQERPSTTTSSGEKSAVLGWKGPGHDLAFANPNANAASTGGTSSGNTSMTTIPGPLAPTSASATAPVSAHAQLQRHRPVELPQPSPSSAYPPPPQTAPAAASSKLNPYAHGIGTGYPYSYPYVYPSPSGVVRNGSHNPTPSTSGSGTSSKSGNALGLDLTEEQATAQLLAPTPILPHAQFLRSYSQETAGAAAGVGRRERDSGHTWH